MHFSSNRFIMSVEFQARYGSMADPRAANRAKQQTKLDIPPGSGFKATKAVPAGRNGTIPPATSTFKAIREQFVKTGEPWSDPDFPADYTSLDASKPELQTKLVWMRPKEIFPGKEAQFIFDGASRFDVKQGFLGNCWFLSTMASLSLQPDLFDKVVPKDQNFQTGYCGAFRFNFWMEGQWREVIVDDRLPTCNKKLYYVHSSTLNEFWSALLEKAYAKLKGSYIALKGGRMVEALCDFTGGAAEMVRLEKETPESVARILEHACKYRSVITTCTKQNKDKPGEVKMENGLVAGHAFSVISFVGALKDTKGNTVDLIRLRNPWGSAVEWNGAWRDNGPEWNNLTDQQKRQLGIEFKEDGEFWMTLSDFLEFFYSLEMAHLNPAESTEDKNNYTLVSAYGAFKARVNAGGWLGSSTFHINPQFRLTIPGNEDEKVNVLINIHQKGFKKGAPTCIAFSYNLYEIRDANAPLDEKFYSKQRFDYRGSNPYVASMMYSRHQLKPGQYIIVPGTIQPDQEFEFILRIFTKGSPEGSLDSNNNLIEELSPQNEVQEMPETLVYALPPLTEQANAELRGVFEFAAGEDKALDAYELRKILKAALKHDFKVTRFDVRLNKQPQLRGRNRLNSVTNGTLPRGSIDGDLEDYDEETGLDEIASRGQNGHTTKSSTMMSGYSSRQQSEPRGGGARRRVLDTFRNLIHPEPSQVAVKTTNTAHISLKKRPSLHSLKSMSILNLKIKKPEDITLETARSLLSYMDLDRSGFLEYEEFKDLWGLMRAWRKIFLDHLRSTENEKQEVQLSSIELRKALSDAGYSLDNKVYSCAVMRYAGRDGLISFDEFVQVCTRLRGLYELFEALKSDSDDTITLKKTDFLSSTMFL